MNSKEQSKTKMGVLIGIMLLLISALLVGACAKAPAPATPAPGTPAATPTPRPPEVIWATYYYYSTPTAETAVLTKWWTELVSERTGGRLKFKYFFSESLAPPEATLQAMKGGVYDFGVPLPGAQQVTLHRVARLPCLPGGELAQMKANIDLLAQVPEIQKQWADWDAMWLFRLVFMPRQINSKVPIYKLSDLKGMKFRSTGEIAFTLEAAGASVIILPSPEIYTAFQRGMIDAFDCPWSMVTRFKTYEFAKYISTLTVGTGQNDFMVRKSFYEKLPADIQKVIQDSIKDMLPKSVEYFVAETEKIKKIFDDNGVKIIEFPKADQKEFTDKYAKPQWDIWLKDREKEGLGAPAQKILTLYLSLIEKYETQK